ncbi:MAG: nitrate- and nitrite sensing domain-containing protein [Sulfuricella sp.]
MKNNQPVTQREVAVSNDATFVTKTDLKGLITYANQEFVNISGFSERELLGSSHNIVRHPDMPPEAFEDLWTTVKNGFGWEGIVKNRCKNGDHYWVHAHVTPIREGKEVTGYTSVRRSATRVEIERAEKLYEVMRSGKSVDLHKGENSLLSRVSMRWRLTMLLIFPILGLLYFSTSNILEKSHALNEISAMQTLTSLAVKSSALIHEAQKERGLSAGFLSSKGAKFADELAKQREETDKRVEDLRQLAGSLDQTSLDKGFSDALTTALDKLKPLKDTRSNITAQLLVPKDSFNFYTGLISAWLDVISYTAKASTNEKLARATNAYLMFLNGKEMAGRERATVNAAFSADKFEWDAFQRFVALLANQKTYFDLFHTYADQEAITSYQDKIPADVVAEVEKYRQIAMEKAITGGFDVDPSLWFKAITKKIDAMKDVENVLSDNLQAMSGNLAAQAKRLLWTYVMLSAGVMLTTLLFGIWIIRVLLRELGGEPNYAREVAREIASGNLDTEIHSREGDTVSLMVAMKNMRNTLVYMIRESQRVSEEALRVRAALDASTANVIIADTEGKIIYTNHSVQRMFSENQEAIRSELPHFDSDKILGSNFDSFHKNPAHPRGILNSITSLHEATIRIGGRTFNLTVIPVYTPKGQRVGTAVEWVDATQELKIQGEVQEIVGAALNGDFTKRLNISDKQGFMRELSLGINQLVETSEVGLGEVLRVLEALAKGDLTETINNEYQGTFGQLKDYSNTTVESLQRLVGEIKETVDQINTAAGEIASGNSDLSQRTEEQASSLEETASSMEELTSTVKHNADNARQANQLAIGASNVAVKGGDVVSQVVETMSSINESSRKIVDIISVIDGIAFQTNILALNAAVEAARAGEQGRGFAVVAGEVRSLAQRSAGAAKEIKTLIGDSVEKVENGSKLVANAGQTMDEIVSAIKRVTDIMAEISAASAEQSAGIEQVNKAITQMDEVTQQNAALVEEAAAAAESLEEQAHNLSASVSVFKIDSGRMLKAPSSAILQLPG